MKKLILKPSCTDEFVVLKIVRNNITRYIATEPIYKWMGDTTWSTGYLGNLVTELEINQRYKYASISGYCLFYISDDGNCLLEWNWGD